MMACMSTRRDFLRTGGFAAAASTVPSHPLFAGAVSGFEGQLKGSVGGTVSPIRLGMCSYTFREFDRAHVIGFMKELKLTDLNAKDVKDHLPMTPPDATQAAVADYKAAGIKLTAVGTVYF